MTAVLCIDSFYCELVENSCYVPSVCCMTCLIISWVGCSKRAKLCQELEKSVVFQDKIDWSNTTEA